ncbi:MAG: glutaconyl-CoA decarboxylase subunit beta [Campylobacteraceae bacterium 4484_4]|nr:MAG: glutaconyl-CoA decarboxylase subunit beta [Campylobacteraceae bacterium 4484_4]
MRRSIWVLLLLGIALFIPLMASGDQNNTTVESEVKSQNYQPQTISELFRNFYRSTGFFAMSHPKEGVKTAGGEEMSLFAQSGGRVMMFVICLLLLYLAVAKGFEPLLLLPIGFGGILANIPIAELAGEHGMLGIIYNMGIANEFFPLLIFMGVGAMTDFGPLLANPKTAILGGAAQFGIFGSLVGAASLSQWGLFDFSLKQSAAISIIGGADGPTSIFIATELAPELLGAIAVAAYSYMALVPVIQPPIMRLLTTKKERQIRMVTLRKVSKIEKMLFPLIVLFLAILILPEATPLIGALCFGNFARESGVVRRLSDTMQNSLINIVTIFLGLGVGSKLASDQFLVAETLGIMVIGLIAFALGTAAGILMAKLMNLFSKEPINPLIGAAGVSAVPMSARVVNKVGQEYNKTNILLMHAMGPNVAGVIGSAVAAGILLSIFK